jgi:hypothetical protein
LITTVRASADWFGAEPDFDAPPDSGCLGAAVRSIAAVSASAPCAGAEADAPVPERTGSPPSFAEAFARPAPADPEGAVPLVPGALEVADPVEDGAFCPLDWAVAGCAGRWPAGVFARPGPDGPDGAVPGVPDADGVFWLPWMGGCEGRCAAGVFARPGPAGPEDVVPGVPGALEVADPAEGGAFWPLDCAAVGCAGRWPAGVFARPGPDGPDGAVPGALEAGGVFWLPRTGGCVGRWPAPGPAGPEGAVLLVPDAAAGGVFWPLECATGGCADRRPAGDVAEAGAFGLPVPPGAAPGVLPAGLGAELGG